MNITVELINPLSLDESDVCVSFMCSNRPEWYALLDCTGYYTCSNHLAELFSDLRKIITNK